MAEAGAQSSMVTQLTTSLFSLEFLAHNEVAQCIDGQQRVPTKNDSCLYSFLTPDINIVTNVCVRAE